jgi:hypothetical protein
LNGLHTLAYRLRCSPRILNADGPQAGSFFKLHVSKQAIQMIYFTSKPDKQNTSLLVSFQA